MLVSRYPESDTDNILRRVVLAAVVNQCDNGLVKELTTKFNLGRKRKPPIVPRAKMQSD